MDDDPLEPKPPVGITRGLIRQRDKMHVGSIFLNRTTNYEFEDPTTGQRHTSPIARDVVLVVIRARGEEICRLWILTAELMGERPYEPATKGNEDGGAPINPRCCRSWAVGVPGVAPCRSAGW